MLNRPDPQSWSVVLEAPDARALATFYRDLLGWQFRTDESGWVTVAPQAGGAYLAFSSSPEYVPPTWPARPGEQQMMLHLDLEVAALGPAVSEAVTLGATECEFQPQDGVRVMRDPAGHPFCLWVRS